MKKSLIILSAVIFLGILGPVVYGVNLRATKTLQSDFFKNDKTAIEIVKKNKNYNIDKFGLRTNQVAGDKNTFAYKVVSALKMLGYSAIKGFNTVGNKTHVLMLKQFQQKNKFRKSSMLTRNVLLAIDDKLAKKEKIFNARGSNFPLYSHIVDAAQNDVSKEYLAYLYVTANKALPDYLQLKSELDHFYCFRGQCGGQVKSITGNPDDDYSFYDSFLLGEQNSSTIWRLNDGTAAITTFLHEYAHYIDGTQRPKNIETMEGIVDTREFYAISYDIDTSLDIPLWDKNCFNVITTQREAFITAYAFNSHGIGGSPDCPTTKYRVAEDFAESFAAYVASGRQFRKAADKNDIIARKYQWLKNNVFQGIEYYTDLPWENTSGCYYMACDEDYIWDGELKVK